MDQAAAVHSAEIEQRLAVTGEHARPGGHLPEPAPAPVTSPVNELPELDLRYGPGLLPQMRHELHGRGEADSTGWREVVAEHDRRIEQLASAARVSGYQGELETEPDYRA